MKCPKCGMRDASVASSQPYCRNCMKSQPEWAEVVEDTLIAEKTNDGLKMDGEKNSLTWLMGLYITGMNKSIPVRIKCRKGAILIERIGG